MVLSAAKMRRNFKELGVADLPRDAVESLVNICGEGQVGAEQTAEETPAGTQGPSFEEGMATTTTTTTRPREDTDIVEHKNPNKLEMFRFGRTSTSKMFERVPDTTSFIGKPLPFSYAVVREPALGLRNWDRDRFRVRLQCTEDHTTFWDIPQR